jgi:putative sigma-54 modulation protein
MHTDILDMNLAIDDALREHIERRLQFALGRFSERIEQLTVRLFDINGPRGGVDVRCRLDVALVGGGNLVAEGRGDNPFALSSRVVRRGRRLVRRALERRRQRRLAPVA